MVFGEKSEMFCSEVCTYVVDKYIVEKKKAGQLNVIENTYSDYKMKATLLHLTFQIILRWSLSITFPRSPVPVSHF